MRQPVEFSGTMIRQGYQGALLDAIEGWRVDAHWLWIYTKGGHDLQFNAGTLELAQQAAQWIEGWFGWNPEGWQS